ncbi:glycosyltransferase family 4 protein [Phenylobacterium parvum]|uniref:glycosyltransferase family 4 protein n=1 Tax=Phenylobacterium parvum TaxID=2201350 RepID=UPI001F5470AB|nr:glycosyltransferase family 4 protein [Phenylobacterium parvum]
MSLPANFTLLQVVPELETGGAEQTTIDVARAVVAAGGRALVASRGGRMETALAAAGGELVRLPMQSKNPLVMLKTAGALRRVIRKQGVSLVHVRSRAPAFPALWAARAEGLPTVATYHGIYLAKGRLKRWYNAVMTRVDRVIANSDYTRAHVLAEHGIAPDKVVAIPRGVDLTRFDPARIAPERIAALRQAWGLADAFDGPLVFLLAGRLTPIKGHETIIAATARLKGEGRDLRVIFAGDDQGRTAFRQSLEAAVRAADLEGVVRLVGHCDDMPAAFLAADVALLPTLVPESFGRAAVEPQVMGRPVIASDHGGTTETVLPGSTGWRAPPGDTAAWASAMAGAIDLGREGLETLGAAARERATRLYSNDAMCAATLAVYEQLVSSREDGK